MESVLEVQKNVKENSEEISDFLKDLDSWATDMAKKDKKLIEAKLNSSISDSPNKEKRSGPNTSSLPSQIILKHKPEKNKTSKQRKEKKAKKEVKQSQPSSTSGAPSAPTVPSPPKKEKIRAYEYDKWDKFDADQECSALDAGKMQYT
ncbi:RNA polymerase II-associated protein 3 [Eurytemora carolleeae]|uniref:RNA polymerase II-associated protein 3 n=1 Tax=Eurytemora carolleeae TaxID=1294199 RepID=UPI000C79488A|nr:RNA polymerase II-associated protein 3 [Eurytemora carolleeae]|eukprot:XP_023348801.1 RNA polymerase II-associated protein 3-like [Eurytemora affinis]